MAHIKSFMTMALPLFAQAATVSSSTSNAFLSSAASCQYGSDGVIIRFKDHDSRRRLTTMTFHPGDKIDRVFTIVPGVSAHLSESSIQAYLKDPSVEGVEADCILGLDDKDLASEPAPDDSPGASSSSPPWGIDRIDSRAGRDGKYTHGAATGKESRIYVLDTGVRVSHQDFEGRALGGWSAGCPTGRESGCTSDWVHEGIITPSRSTCHWHGTHCASTAAGAQYGVANEATVITVQVLSCRGWGSESGVIAGIDWAVADAAKYPGQRSVISMSLGGGKSTIQNEAVKRAHDQGVLVVAAAGNNNGDACQKSPASAPEAITVGSTTSTDTKSWFSNHGQCVDIQAPGSSIVAASATSDTATLSSSGTSMAAPHVAGAAAQLLTVRPAYTAAQVTDVLKCMGTQNAIRGLPGKTVNTFLYAGAVMLEGGGADCAPGGSDPPSLKERILNMISRLFQTVNTQQVGLDKIKSEVNAQQTGIDVIKTDLDVLKDTADKLPVTEPLSWTLTNLNLTSGVFTKVGGADKAYDAHAVSMGTASSLTLTAPPRDSTNRKYVRVCLTTDGNDGPTCSHGMMVGVWPRGAIYTMCGGARGAYPANGNAVEGDQISLISRGASEITVEKNGALLRTCSGLTTTNLVAKVFLYARGASLKEPTLQLS